MIANPVVRKQCQASVLMHAQKTQEQEEGGMDPEALERKRLQEAEAWRLEQLRSGTSSEENANFQVHTSAVHVWWLKFLNQHPAADVERQGHC